MLLKRLMEAQGVSGNEHEIRTLIFKEIKKYVKDVKVDKFGNIVAHKKGKSAPVMVAAHMDEIGLMVKSISEKGNIYVSEIGGLEAMALIGQKVKIDSKKGYINGVVTIPEVSESEELDEAPLVEELIVDTGLNKNELSKKGVEIGTFVEFERQMRTLGSKDIICGKALDDRIGCFVLLELARKLQKSKTDIYFVFTVQEEMGLYGSKTSLYNIDPDWAIVVDVTSANDAKEHSHETTKELGKGPCIAVKDADMISNVCIDDWLKKIAKKKKINVQLEVTDEGTTDALSISVAKGGIPTTVVGVGVRNLHTPMGIAHLKDINQTIELLTDLLKNPPMACVYD